MSADDLILTPEQEATMRAELSRAKRRIEEDPRDALSDVGWMSVRDLFDAYVLTEKENERLMGRLNDVAAEWRERFNRAKDSEDEALYEIARLQAENAGLVQAEVNAEEQNQALRTALERIAKDEWKGHREGLLVNGPTAMAQIARQALEVPAQPEEE